MGDFWHYPRLSEFFCPCLYMFVTLSCHCVKIQHSKWWYSVLLKSSSTEAWPWIWSQPSFIVLITFLWQRQVKMCHWKSLLKIPVLVYKRDVLQMSLHNFQRMFHPHGLTERLQTGRLRHKQNVFYSPMVTQTRFVEKWTSLYQSHSWNYERTFHFGHCTKSRFRWKTDS